jgi:hypothetical protein
LIDSLPSNFPFHGRKIRRSFGFITARAQTTARAWPHSVMAFALVKQRLGQAGVRERKTAETQYRFEEKNYASGASIVEIAMAAPWYG